MQATPITWQLLMDAGWQGKSDLKILCGGETLSPVLAGKLLERGKAVWNCYGPTETTIWSLVHRVAAANGRVVPIGRPIANTQAYVLDSYQQPVPIGARGELYIGGAGLARGYLNRPELTAEKFLQNPFGQEPGSRLYRTGDLVRYGADGTIEFLGRLDHQVKLRGFRIELGEIESVLSRHPAVRQAIVILREDSPGDQRLVAYIVCHEGHSVKGKELKSFLGEKLPNYMIPSGFVFLDALPLTPSGKVDRESLPLAVQSSLDSGTDYVAPRDPVEHVVARIWGEVLKIERVSIVDNFFELGGHSLLATQVMSRVRETFRAELPLRKLFERPTVAGLAASVEEAISGDAAPADISSLLDDVESLSEEEAERLLATKLSEGKT
jgi:acyl carrier protein